MAQENRKAASTTTGPAQEAAQQAREEVREEAVSEEEQALLDDLDAELDLEDVLVAICVAAIEHPDDFDASTVYTILQQADLEELWETALAASNDELVEETEELDDPEADELSEGQPS